jgi:hypothetical protein
MTLSITTLSIKGLYKKLSRNDTELKNALQYAEWHYSECRISFTALLSGIILNVAFDLLLC